MSAIPRRRAVVVRLGLLLVAPLLGCAGGTSSSGDLGGRSDGVSGYGGGYDCTGTSTTPAGNSQGTGSFSCSSATGQCTDSSGAFYGTVDANGSFSGYDVLCQTCNPLPMHGQFSKTSSFSITGSSGSVSANFQCHYAGTGGSAGTGGTSDGGTSDGGVDGGGTTGTPPTISGLTPTSGYPGASFQLTGTCFTPVQTFVTVCGVAVPVTFLPDSSVIVVMVPYVDAQACPVVVVTPCGLVTAPSQFTVVANTTPWSAAATGWYHSVGVRTDGSLWTWGYDQYGQLGRGLNYSFDQRVPTWVANGFTAASGGFGHTVALKQDGTLWAWGYNEYGMLGDGTTAHKNAPVQVGSGFTAVAAGGYHTVALKADGTLWAFGLNQSGQLGDGTTTNRLSPVQVLSGVARVAAGWSGTAAVKTDGTLWAWGENSKGQLGDGTLTERHSPVQVGTGFASVAAGTHHAVAVKQDGTLWAWGSNQFGQVGDGTRTDRRLPVKVGEGFASPAAGYSFSAAVKADGTLWTWGSNAYGQIGNGATADVLLPWQAGTGYASVEGGGGAPGLGFTLALKQDGTLWAWGSNQFGQLGIGSTTDQYLPGQVH